MKKICVTKAMHPALQELLDEKGIPLELVLQGGDLNVEDTGAEGQESTLDVLYSGGWITCAAARTTARNLGITLSQMGEILDHLKVKVKQCGLGCF